MQHGLAAIFVRWSALVVTDNNLAKILWSMVMPKKHHHKAVFWTDYNVSQAGRCGQSCWYWSEDASLPLMWSSSSRANMFQCFGIVHHSMVLATADVSPRMPTILLINLHVKIHCDIYRTKGSWLVREFPPSIGRYILVSRGSSFPAQMMCSHPWFIKPILNKVSCASGICDMS